MAYPKHPEAILVKNEFYPNGLTEKNNYDYYMSVKDKLLFEVFNRDLIIFLALDDRITVLRKGKTTHFMRLNRGNFDDVFHSRMLSIHCSMKSIERFGIIDIDTDNFKEAKQAATDTYEFANSKIPFIDNAWIKFTGKSSFHIVCNFKNDMYIDRVKIMLRNYLQKSPLAKDYDIDLVTRGERTRPNLDLSPNKYRGGYIALHSLSTIGLRCMKIAPHKLRSFQKEEAIITTT
jgi:hypothetical protein